MFGVPKGEKYPEAVRKFAFALCYANPSAYEIVRKQFDNNLPHRKTITAWLQNSDINGEPGIRKEMLDRLTKFVEELNGEKLICSLIFDEMYIRKQVYWDPNKYDYVGYPTYGVMPNVNDVAAERNNNANIETNEMDHNESNDAVTARRPRSSRSAALAATATIAAMDEEPEEPESKSSKKARKTTSQQNESSDDEIRREDTLKKKPKKPKSALASRALVFMLRGVNKYFQFPIAYHFTNALNGKELADLVSEVIFKVSECGVTISNLTFDGAKENLGMCELLGANLDALSEDFQPHIKNPYDQSIIYLILDPSHMEKLLRNLLGNKGVIYDENDSKIEWSYFVKLQEISKDGNMLTHKLTRKHTKEFARNKMNVRLAVQTFSSSVAESIELLRQNQNPDFKDSEPTTKFVRMMDKLFDILNSRNTRHSNIYKRALNFVSKREIFEFMKECIPRFESLKIDKIQKKKGKKGKKGKEVVTKVNVLKTINATPVLGFLMNLTNIPLMYARYCEEDENDPSLKPMKYLRTYSFSQDHLELFFSKIRARNGYNDNPNVVQFKGAFRRLLVNSDIKPPQSANCMLLDDFDVGDSFHSHAFKSHSNVYSVSSKRPTIDVLSDDSFKRNLKLFDETNLEEISDLQGMEESHHILDGLGDASIAYAAKIVENGIRECHIYCSCCESVFQENEKLNFRSMIESKTPCSSTYYICAVANKWFNMYKPDLKSKKNIDYRVIYSKIFQCIDFKKLYVNTNFKDHEEHFYHLIKCIVRHFLSIKTAQISKELTYEEYDRIIRNRLTKWIHFSGQ